MSDVLGRGTIELVGDARKLRASIAEAKKSIRTLGEGQKDISKSASASIDNYIGRLQAQNATFGKSVREVELYKLALRGASTEQLRTADSALKLAERHKLMSDAGSLAKTAFLALGVGLIAAAAAFDQFVKKAGAFQDLAEKAGDTAEAIASLAVSAAIGGTSMEAVTLASVRMTKSLTGVDDESKAAGAAITALGLNLTTFKNLKPADQFEAVAKALAGFEEGTGKTAVAVALFGRAGAEMLPFLRELAIGAGRQNILTKEQIRLADEYSDKQKKLTAQISLHVQAIASQMVPAYNDLKLAFIDAIKGIAGMQSGAASLANDTSIADFADNAALSLSFLVDMGDGVARIFQVIGKSIGGASAAMDAFKRFEFGIGARIMKEMDRDIVALLNRPTLGTLLENRIAARKAAAKSTAGTTPDLPKLDFEGARKKEGADKAVLDTEKERQRLIEQGIKSNQDALEAWFNRNEDINIALGKMYLKEYNDRKKIEQGFVDATIAAQAYIDTLNKQMDREIAGVGRGEQFRSRQEGISAIEDKQTVERRRLESELRKGQIDKENFDRYLAVVNDTYKKEIAIYQKRTDTLIAMEGDWLNGATEALQNYYDQSRNIAKQTENIISGSFQRLEDELVEFTKSGKFNIRSLGDFVVAEMNRMVIRSQLGKFSKSLESGDLFKTIASWFGGGSGASVGGDWTNYMATASAGGFASGGSFTVPGSGGIDSTPIRFMATPGEKVTVETPGQQRDGMNVNIVFNVTGQMDKRSQAQIATAAGEGVRRAMARNT